MALVILPAERIQLTLEILYVRFMKCSSRKVFKSNYIVSVYLDWGCNTSDPVKPNPYKNTRIKVKHVAGHLPGIMKRSIFWRKSNNTNLQKMVVLQDFPIKSALFGLVSSYKWPPVRFAKVPGSKFVGLPDSCHSPQLNFWGLSRGEGAAGDDVFWRGKLWRLGWYFLPNSKDQLGPSNGRVWTLLIGAT